MGRRALHRRLQHGRRRRARRGSRPGRDRERHGRLDPRAGLLVGGDGPEAHLWPRPAAGRRRAGDLARPRRPDGALGARLRAPPRRPRRSRSARRHHGRGAGAGLRGRAGRTGPGPPRRRAPRVLLGRAARRHRRKRHRRAGDARPPRPRDRRRRDPRVAGRRGGEQGADPLRGGGRVPRGAERPGGRPPARGTRAPGDRRGDTGAGLRGRAPGRRPPPRGAAGAVPADRSAGPPGPGPDGAANGPEREAPGAALPAELHVTAQRRRHSGPDASHAGSTATASRSGSSSWGRPGRRPRCSASLTPSSRRATGTLAGPSTSAEPSPQRAEPGEVTPTTWGARRRPCRCSSALGLGRAGHRLGAG